MPRIDPIRLAILAMHPVQYHSPLYRNICNAPAFDGQVLYLDTLGLEGLYDAEFDTVVEWDIPLLEGHAHEFLRNRAWNNQGGFFSRINPGLSAALKRGRFDAILIQGYSILSFWIALLAARRHGIKVVWRGEVTLKPSDTATGPRQRARNAMVRSFLGQMAAPLVVAEAAANGQAALASTLQTPLPKDITNRSNAGFTTPIADWLKADTRT